MARLTIKFGSKVENTLELDIMELIIGRDSDCQLELEHELVSRNHAKVRLVGDGVSVNRDAIGSRIELVFDLADGSSRSLHRTQRGANCFSAENGRSIYFGLGRGSTDEEAGTPTELRVTWPNGATSQHAVELGAASDVLTVTYGD